MMPEIWAAPPEPAAGWPPCEWCGKVLQNPQYFVVRGDGRWFILCLTCITAGDNGRGSVTCHRCGRALWRNDARTVEVRHPFKKKKTEMRYQCPGKCLPDLART